MRNVAGVLTPLGSGKYSDVFKFQRGGGKPLVMKISYYRDDTLCAFLQRLKKGDVKGALAAKRRDAIQVSSAFSRIAKRLMRGVSPHFVLVYCDQDCKAFAPRLGPLLRERLKALSPVQQKYNNVCFMEMFDDNMTRFLNEKRYDEAALRAMIFQVLYTLAALQKAFPGFRHNDLSTNNVLVKKLSRPTLVSYAFGGKTYYVNVAEFAALSDYDFTHVPKHPYLANERVLSGKYKVDGRRNDSYDTHFFLKSVLKCIQRRADEFPRTMDFLKRLRMRQEDRQNATVMRHMAPAALLRDPYFEPLTRRPPGRPAAAYKA